MRSLFHTLPPPKDILKTHDSQLRDCYAWYATLEQTDPQRVTWDSVKLHGGSVGLTQLMLMLLNFEVGAEAARAGGASLASIPPHNMFASMRSLPPPSHR